MRLTTPRSASGRHRAASLVPLEYQTHVGVADALGYAAAPGWITTHFPAGELRHPAVGERLKKMGLKPGFGDFLLIDPRGQHHWLELKRGNAPLSIEQEAFRDAMLERHVPWALARSVEEAIERLQDWRALDGLRLSI